MSGHGVSAASLTDAQEAQLAADIMRARGEQAADGVPTMFGHRVPRSLLFAGASGFGVATLAGAGVLAFGKVSRGLPTWALFAGVLTGAVATGLTLGAGVAYPEQPFGYDPANMRPKECPPEGTEPSNTRKQLDMDIEREQADAAGA